MRRHAITLVLALTCAACSSDPEAAAGSSAAALASVDAAPPARGLEAPDNDAETVSHLRAVLLCPPGETEPCPARAAWLEYRRAKNRTLDATLVTLLEDERAAVRALAADALADAGGPYREDPTLALRVLTAAQREQQADVAPLLGLAVGRINGAQTGQTPALRALLREHALPAMRKAALASYLLANGSEEDVAFLASLARTSATAEDRLRAALALGVQLPPDTAARACKQLLALGDVAQVDVAEESILAATRTCAGDATPIVKRVAARAQAGTASLSTTVLALRDIMARADSTAELKTQAKQAAMQLVTNTKNGEGARAAALDLLSIEPDARDELLAFLEKDATQGAAQTRGVVDALHLLLEQVDLTAAQRKSALATARAIVAGDKSEGSSRRLALELVIQHEPKDKAFAKKYSLLQSDW